jgi:hypothetical protein
MIEVARTAAEINLHNQLFRKALIALSTYTSGFTGS